MTRRISSALSNTTVQQSLSMNVVDSLDVKTATLDQHAVSYTDTIKELQSQLEVI